MANILKLLHPFIPFFTECIWQKNNYKTIYKMNLVSSDWPVHKPITHFKKNQVNINDIIELISCIRSTKSELKITPKLQCDLFFSEKSTSLQKLVKDNFNMISRVGRISKIIKEKKENKNTVEILVLNEKISLIFNENIDLLSQKENIMKKLENLEKKINSLNNKLDNKEYLINAPKEIVQNDKNLVKELTIEQVKLRSIVSSIT